ncbi:hypothetical protein RQP46_006169 [Phenoliferia psychrophenolica]
MLTPDDQDQASQLKARDSYHEPSVEESAVVQDSFQDAFQEPEIHGTTWLVVAAAVVNYMAGVIVLSGIGFWAAVITSPPSAGGVGGPVLTHWIQQAWNAPVAIFAPSISRVGDLVGRRNIWLAATFLGFIGSIILGSANSSGMALGGTIVFGLGFANSGNVFAVPAEVLPRRHRGTAALKLTGFIHKVAILAGASLITTNPGGYPGWRTLFWICAGAHLLSFILIFVAYHPPASPNPEGLSVMERILDFDLVGTLLFACALCPILVALFAGGLSSPWSSPKIIAPLVVGCAFVVIFCLHQRFVRQDGLMHHAMFQNRNAALCLFAITVEGFVYQIFNSFYGAETGVLYDPRPLYLGLRFCIFGVCAIAASPIYMYTAYKYKLLIEQLSFGFVLFLVGIIGMATLSPADGKTILIYCAICGVGFASPISCLLSVAQLSMDPVFAGLISGLMISFRSVGGAVGVAICSAIYTAKIGEYLPLAVTKAEIAQAYAHSYRFIWIACAPFVLVSLICCLCMKSIKQEMNFLVDRPVEEIHHKHDHTEAPIAVEFKMEK